MSLNRLQLIGNVGKEPKIRQFENGSVANFTLATTDKGYTRKDGTQLPDRTEWHNVSCFVPGLVQVIQQYVHKGSKLYVDGKLRSRRYTGKDGVERVAYECHVDNMELLDRPQGQQGQPSSYPQQGHTQAPQYPQQPQQQGHAAPFTEVPF